MRHPAVIAEELETLVDGTFDREADHVRADRLLLELIQVLAPDDTQSAPTAAAVRRAIDAWERGSKRWWWA